MKIENGVNRKMIAVSILEMPAPKASLRTPFVPAFGFNQIGRVVYAGGDIGQIVAFEQVLIEQYLVKDDPFIFETHGSGPEIVLFEGIEKIVGKVVAQTVIFGLIVEIPGNQYFRSRIFEIDRIDNSSQLPGKGSSLVSRRSRALKSGRPVIYKNVNGLVKENTFNMQDIPCWFHSHPTFDLGAECLGIN